MLEEKEHKINILEETQSKNETTISVIKEEIENYKNKKQIQANSIKKNQKKYMQKTKQYRIMKISVVKMKQRLKNKKNKSNQSHTIETEYKMI